MSGRATALLLAAALVVAGGCKDDGATQPRDVGVRPDVAARVDGQAGDGAGGDGAAGGDSAAPFNRYSLALESGGGYLDLGRAVDFTGASFTKLSFALWVKRRATATQSDYAVVTFDSQGTFSTQVLLIWSFVDGKTSLACRVPTVVARAEVAQPDRWHHVACVYDGAAAAGTRLRVYLDGVRVATAGGPAAMPMRNLLWVGRFYQSARHDGWLDELGIWRETALDDRAIAALYNAGKPIDLGVDSGDYNASSALSGYFRMGDDNGGAGSVVLDRAGTRAATLDGTGSFAADVP